MRPPRVVRTWLEAFGPNDLGFLGYVDGDGSVVFYRAPTRLHNGDSVFDLTGVDDLPWVEVLYVHGGSDARMVDAVAQLGMPGIVVASMGAATIPPSMRRALAELAGRGTAVVVSSRVGSGRIIQTDGMLQDKLIAADNLIPQKARVLLQLGLTRTQDPSELQEIYLRY